MCSPSPDSEAVQAVVGLCPPSVEYREIQPTIQHYFLSACAGRFERPTRIVEPDIDTLHEMAADIDVVILNKDEAICKCRVAHHFGNLLQDTFAGLVVWMRFSCEDKLHRPVRIVHHGIEPGDIRQHEVRTLVGGKAAREA